MKKKTEDKRTQEWMRHPSGTIPYGPFARIGDWWCAGRDARCGMPELLVAAGADSPAAERVELGANPAADTGTVNWATPRTVFVGQLGRGRAEKEWIRYQAAGAHAQVQLTQAFAKRRSASHRLEVAQNRLEALTEPTQEELETRVSGEERTADAVRIGRRKREFAERRETLGAEISQARVAIAECDRDIARLRETIRIRFEVVRTQALIIGAYVRRRCAAYLARLIRKHPDGKRIGVLVRSGWQDEPRWSIWDTPPEPAENQRPDDHSVASTGGE